MRLFLGVLAFALLPIWSATASAAEHLAQTGKVEFPICQPELLSSLPAGFEIDIQTDQPPAPQCANPLFSRPPGHLQLLAPKPSDGEPISLIAPDASWRLNNLSTAPPTVCPPVERPGVMFCSPKDVTSGKRKGASAHLVRSLHDARVDLAELILDVEANESAPVLVALEFDINVRGPDLGPEYAEKIRQHFVLDVVRTDLADSTKTVTDSAIPDILLGRANRIVQSVTVGSKQRLKAQFSFRPIVERTRVISNLQTNDSTDISLEVWVSAISVSRGILPSTIHQAVRDNDLVGLRAIIASGGNISAKDPAGVSALALAHWLGRDAIAEELSSLSAEDNRAAILNGPTLGLLKVLQSGIPPERIVADMLSRSIVIPPKAPGNEPAPPSSQQAPNMKFDVNATLDTEGCDRTAISFSSAEANRIDTTVKGTRCFHNNTALGLYAALLDLSSIATFDAYRLATTPSDTTEGLGATVYTAHLLSGAYGGSIYEGEVFLLGSTRGATAAVGYSVRGSATIPACKDPSVCAVFQNIWYSEKHEGDGYLTQISVEQNGGTKALSPDQRFPLDLSQGAATIKLEMSRSFSHHGSTCCMNLQQNHFASVRLAELFVVPPSRSLLRATHAAYGQPVGQEDLRLTVARSNEIIAQFYLMADRQSPGLPVPLPGTTIDHRLAITYLAQYHDGYSHPHSARYSDLLLRLALLDAVERDVNFSAAERTLIGLTRQTLANAARSFYLPDTMRLFSGLKEKAARLRIKEAAGVAGEINKSSGELTKEERAVAGDFLKLAASGGETFAQSFLARFENVQSRSDLARLLLDYVDAASARLMEISGMARLLAIEISQFTSTDPLVAAEKSLQELAVYRVN